MRQPEALPPVLSFEAFLRTVRFAEHDDWAGPYPWQQRFAEHCATVGAAPPDWVVAPTGAGKTTAIDALVWGLAMQADAPPAERTASTRMVWAIDRRILVDEVYDRASELARCLELALDDFDDPLHGMALRLLKLAVPGECAQSLSPDERRERELRPLAVTRWRGGIAQESELLSPFQPQVITSTVGQIGSRLLFRGYGVGQGSLALSAGLASCDTTICLDEAHLAGPFRETVAAIQARRHDERSSVTVPDLRLVTLTATPPNGLDGDVLGVGPEDHSRLGKRWTGSKRLELREADGTTDERLAAAVDELRREGRLVIACVANRVLTARLVHDRLRKACGDDADVLLLIGPQRQTDRDRQLVERWRILVEGKQPERPTIVVATQSIEVGLDFDFDAMVTQSASASALTQRLGRLNRSGKRPGRAIVIRDEGFPLYRGDEEAAWDWLSELPGAPAEIDVSVKALSEDERRPSDRHPPFAATLTDAIVRQLAQTSERPGPYADPAIEPLLVGPEERPANDVALVWRGDLRMEDAGPDGRVYREALLSLAPPQPEELLTLSLSAARTLISARVAHGSPGRSLQYDADIEGGARDPQPAERLRVTGDVPFLVRRGRDILHGVARDANGTDTITLAGLRTGDTVILPTSLGGSDELGLNHRSRIASDAGPDIAEPGASRPSHSKAAGPVPLRLSLEATRARIAPYPSWPDDEKMERHAKATWRSMASALLKATAAGDAPSSADMEHDTLSDDQIAELIRRFPNRDTNPATNSVVSWLKLDADSRGDLPNIGVWAWRLRRVDPIGSDDLDLVDPLAIVEDEDDGGDSQSDDQVGKTPVHDASLDDIPLDKATWVLVPVPRARSGRDERASRPTPPSLEEHVEAVGTRARSYLTALDLRPEEAQAVELAALAHDLGKSDPRFQTFLADGAPDLNRPLAKSTFGTDDPRRSRLARQRAGVPTRFAHETPSVTILHAALNHGDIPKHLSAADPALALHLTGTHHGRGRPIWSVPAENGDPAEPFEVALAGIAGGAAGDESDGWLNGTWLQQFDDLLDRYGPWTLAYLEGLVVLADRTVSREGG